MWLKVSVTLAPTEITTLIPPQSELYEGRPRTEGAFASEIRQVMASLLDVARNIPSQELMSVSGKGSELLQRTVASLHLGLYQVGFDEWSWEGGCGPGTDY